MTSQTGVGVHAKLLYTEEAFINMVRDKVLDVYKCIFLECSMDTIELGGNKNLY